MADTDKVTLFKEFDEDGFRVRVHVVAVEVAACFVIQVFDLKRSLPVHEEVCPPMKHYPRLFVHEEDLIDLEIKTEEILRQLNSERRMLAAIGQPGRGKSPVSSPVPHR